MWLWEVFSSMHAVLHLAEQIQAKVSSDKALARSLCQKHSFSLYWIFRRRNKAWARVLGRSWPKCHSTVRFKFMIQISTFNYKMITAWKILSYFEKKGRCCPRSVVIFCQHLLHSMDCLKSFERFPPYKSEWKKSIRKNGKKSWKFGKTNEKKNTKIYPCSIRRFSIKLLLLEYV